MEEYNIVSGKIGPKFGEDGFTRSDADVVVFIPEFYYKIIDDATGKKRYFYVASKEKAASKSIPGLVDMLGDITLIVIALLAQEKLQW